MSTEFILLFTTNTLSTLNPTSYIMNQAQSTIALLMVLFLVFRSYSSESESTMKPKKKKPSSRQTQYIPSHLERNIMSISRSLKYDVEMVDECDLYRNESRTDIYKEFHDYMSMLDKFSNATKRFRTEIDDIRLLPTKKREKLCKKMDKVLHESFHANKDLSLTKSGGFVEPLLPPLRHPRMCRSRSRSNFLMSLEYLVHDFGKICRDLDRTTRTVFFDLGASLNFHGRHKPPT